MKVGLVVVSAALCALGVGCNSQSAPSSNTQSVISPLSRVETQWLVGSWLQNSDGIGTNATPPLRHGRLSFQVNPPLFQWEGFRTVGVPGDPVLPGPLDCRLREISSHFTLKAATDDRSNPGAQTVTYFVDGLQLIPDPNNDSLCPAYVARKTQQMQVERESYFFDIYQDPTGELVDVLRQAAFAHVTPTLTSDGCTGINGVFADADDAAIGSATGHDYVWSQTSCSAVTITEQAVSQSYDPNTGAAQITAVAPGTTTTCGPGGDGSCTIGGNAPLTLVTHSDLTVDQFRTTTTETATLTPFGDLSVGVVTQDDAGNTLSSTTRIMYMQDAPAPSQND